jgi:hypothetical protein
MIFTTSWAADLQLAEDHIFAWAATLQLESQKLPCRFQAALFACQHRARSRAMRWLG